MHLSNTQIRKIFESPLAQAMGRLFDSWRLEHSLTEGGFIFVIGGAFSFPATSLYDNPADKRSRELIKADRSRVNPAVKTVLAACGIERSWPEASIAKPGYTDMHFKATFDEGSILLKGLVGITADDEIAEARLGVRFRLPFDILEQYLLSLDSHVLFDALTDTEADDDRILEAAAKALGEVSTPLPPGKLVLAEGILQVFERLRLAMTRSLDEQLLSLPLLLRRPDFKEHVTQKHGVVYDEVVEAYLCQSATGHEELRGNHKRDSWQSDIEIVDPSSGETVRLPGSRVASKTKHLGISERGKLLDIVLEALRGTGTKVIITAFDLVDIDNHQPDMRTASGEKIKFWGRSGVYRIGRGERLMTYKRAEDIVNGEATPGSRETWSWPGR